MDGSASVAWSLEEPDSAYLAEKSALSLSRRCPLRGCGEFTGFASAADLSLIFADFPVDFSSLLSRFIGPHEFVNGLHRFPKMFVDFYSSFMDVQRFS